VLEAGGFGASRREGRVAWRIERDLDVNSDDPLLLGVHEGSQLYFSNRI
jgi:hypothetical protein